MNNITIREMQKEDYEAVYALWLTIHGFGMRSVDDSEAGVHRFLDRNPGTSVVAENKETGEIIGSILCGSDGRRGCFYHVCVREDHRRRGIGKAMATWCMKALKDIGINKVSLIAFKSNELGNSFWHEEGWTLREDLNYYDFVLNEENITRFNS
ncbi:MAG: GNAT family N-acetyltransferase [Lachnospiraceae bacterium]|nr:GNAT family N-acetyltransferase [Lachnospiraceae bacterium]